MPDHERTGEEPSDPAMTIRSILATLGVLIAGLVALFAQLLLGGAVVLIALALSPEPGTYEMVEIGRAHV